MVKLENGWKKYWENRVKEGEDYYGKEGSNADKIIKILDIHKIDNVLDIGCANGAHLKDIQKKTNAKCYGIDISPVAISLNKNKKVRLKVADMEDTGYPSNFFHKVFSLGVFEHTPKSLSVFRELNRIMKKGGLAHITVPNKISFFHLTKNVKMALGIWDLGYEKSFSNRDIRKIAKKTGFAVERIWIEPHLKPNNVFNILDNTLNRVNRNYFGFFLETRLRKVKNV